MSFQFRNMRNISRMEEKLSVPEEGYSMDYLLSDLKSSVDLCDMF